MVTAMATATAIARQITTIAVIKSAVESAKRDGIGDRWLMPSRKKVSGEDNFGSIVGFVGLIFEIYSKYVAGRSIANFVA